MSRTRLTGLAFVLTVGLVAASCGGGAEGEVRVSGDPKTEGTPARVSDVLAADGRFNELLGLVGVAGLADSVTVPGPITVFAPTNDAVAALLAGLSDACVAALQAENSQVLQDILLHHVLPGIDGTFAPNVPDEEILDAESPDERWITFEGVEDYETALGDSLTVDAPARLAAESLVVDPDIGAPNGVIHAVESVIIPADVAAVVEGGCA